MYADEHLRQPASSVFQKLPAGWAKTVIRTTAHLLHPPLLDEVGFTSAARWYVDETAKRSGINANLEMSAIPSLTKAAELALFRVL